MGGGFLFRQAWQAQAGLAPQLGLLVRLWVSALVLLAISAPKLAEFLRALKESAGRQGVEQIALFEGLIAGTLGMLAYYTPFEASTPGWCLSPSPSPMGVPAWRSSGRGSLRLDEGPGGRGRPPRDYSS